MVEDKDKYKEKHLNNSTEHLAWWGRERSAKRVTVSPAEAISGPLYKPPPCAPLYIFVQTTPLYIFAHLCTSLYRPLPPTFPEHISQWSSGRGRTIGTSAPEPPPRLAYLVARLGVFCCSIYAHF